MCMCVYGYIYIIDGDIYVVYLIFLNKKVLVNDMSILNKFF